MPQPAAFHECSNSGSLVILSAQQSQRGLSTTRAGTLLKQQIPIRTFEEWNEIRPGFLEADLVAHCGTDIEGGYLYTLTLTDVATGWTECLPLLYRSQETVLVALQQARLLFPFPILGIDTDNGGEFIKRGSNRLLRARTHHLHARTPVLEKRPVFCGGAPFRRL